MSYTDEELAYSRTLLGVEVGASEEIIKKAFLQKSYALIRSGGSEEDKEQLTLARDALLSLSHVAERQQLAAAREEAKAVREERRTAALLADVEKEEARERERFDPKVSPLDPRSFDSWIINAAAPPLVGGLAILVGLSPLGGLLAGFYVWMHEFGHATVAWMTGRRALPLPIGWTNVAEERSTFVYFGVLFLFTVLFVAGAREKKIVPMIAAVVLALAQAVMTWRWPEAVGYKWSIFAGVGGEFYLSAAAVAAFFFRLPEKFRWGVCRYVFLFIGAACFYRVFVFWRKVKRGEEGIPYGTLIGGEEDEGGDMNILHHDYDWTQREIIHTYNNLGTACLVGMVAIYACFALRLDRWPRRWLSSDA